MPLLKQCDARNRLSTGRIKSQHSYRPVDQVDRAGSSGVEVDRTRANRLTFAEDFMLEHCHSGRHVTVIEISASSEAAPKETLQSAQHFGFPS
jgi:hypothetical protein